MKRGDYVGFGSEEDNFVFCIDEDYNEIDDSKNVYLHVHGNSFDEGKLPIKITPKQLKGLSRSLFELAERVEKRKI